MLFKSMLLSAFGGTSDHPKRLTILKLTSLVALAGLGGHVLAKGLEELPQLPSPGWWPIFLVGACMMQLAVLVTLLAGAGPKKTFYGDALARLLLVLPLGGLQRWLALLLPSIILVILAMLLITESLARLLLLFDIHPLVLPAAFGAGVFSSLGLVYGLPRIHLGLRILAVGAVLWLETVLLKHIAEGYLAGAAPGQWRLWALTGLLALTGSLFLVSYRSLRRTLTAPQAPSTVRGGSLPPGFWMLKKIVRSPFMAANLALNAVLSGVVAWFVLRSSASAVNSLEFLSFMGAFIAAITASDIRGLSRRLNPSEIVALRGTGYFVGRVYWAGGLVTFVSVLPLCVPLLVEGALAETSFLIARVLFGLATGLFVGMMLTPSQRDITGQFTASAICLLCIIGLPQLFGALQGNSGAALVGLAGGSAVLLLLGWLIEYKRNSYLWRKTNAQK